jgi:hypothetical protein
MKSFRFAVGFIFLIMLSGCRAHVVKISLTNTSAQPVRTIIVDYPDATFGKDTLAPGETYFSLIKPLETGEIKVQFTDAAGTSHKFSGPTLHKNDDGTVEIRFTQDKAAAQASLQH